uniref:hypothetical protein n=1 Tax=Thalassotalea sp. PLHSN55 TaxID=3435888 RepID=UPI003F830138
GVRYLGEFVKYGILFFILINVFVFYPQQAFSAEQTVEAQIQLAKDTSPEDKEWPFSVIGTVVVALIGLISGAIGSLFAPWINWGIEKKRKAIEYKQSRIKDARELLDKADSLEIILSSSIWGFIQTNLTQQEAHSVSSGRVIHGTDHNCMTELHMRKQIISRMLSRLEKEWEL